MMRRNVVSLIKFFLLAAFIVFLTVVVFRYVRTSPNHEIVTPAAVIMVTDGDSPKHLIDTRQNFNDHLYQVRIKGLLRLLHRLGRAKQVQRQLNLLHSDQYRIVTYTSPDPSSICLRLILRLN